MKEKDKDEERIRDAAAGTTLHYRRIKARNKRISLDVHAPLFLNQLIFIDDSTTV